MSVLLFAEPKTHVKIIAFKSRLYLIISFLEILYKNQQSKKKWAKNLTLWFFVQTLQYGCLLEFLLILPVLRPTHGSLPISPLIDIPKGFSSKTTLEVAPRALEFRISNA